MKYNININQKALASTKLNLTDCAILDWLIVYCNSKNQKIDDNRIEGLTWIDYGQIIKDLPLLRIKSKSAISARVSKIRDEGFIITKVFNGDRMYVGLTEKVDIIFFDSVRETERKRSPKRTVSVRKYEPTIILNNNNTKQGVSQSETVEGSLINKVIDLFKDVNPSFARLYPRKAERDAIRRLVKLHGEEKVIAIVSFLPKSNADRYAPTITTPYELEKNLGKLIAWGQKQKDFSKNKQVHI